MANRKIKWLRIRELACKRELELQERRKDKRYKRAMSWLLFSGLLQGNVAKPRRVKVSLDDLLFAGEVEPRVLELLPAVVREFKDLLKITEEKMPADLKRVLNAIQKNANFPEFRGVQPMQYLQWLRSPALELAKKRLSPRARPRERESSRESGEISEKVRSKRMKLGFTQIHLAKQFKLSLRALRDIEQGYSSSTLAHTIEILNALDLRLSCKDVAKE